MKRVANHGCPTKLLLPNTSNVPLIYIVVVNKYI